VPAHSCATEQASDCVALGSQCQVPRCCQQQHATCPQAAACFTAWLCPPAFACLQDATIFLRAHDKTDTQVRPLLPPSLGHPLGQQAHTSSSATQLR
jgi:hypothetical protein